MMQPDEPEVDPGNATDTPPPPESLKDQVNPAKPEGGSLIGDATEKLKDRLPDDLKDAPEKLKDLREKIRKVA